MNFEDCIQITPRIEEALSELRGTIAEHYPQATFVVEKGLDPPGVYLVATVDIDDTDEVFAVVVDRMVDMQVEEGLPVYVVALRPIERVLAQLREQQSRAFPPPLPIG